jgi:hypothetical protein
LKEHFTGEVESHAKPRASSVEEQLQYAVEYKEVGNKKSAAEEPLKLYRVKKTSILYRLPY